jgi:hypothetical protein
LREHALDTLRKYCLALYAGIMILKVPDCIVFDCLIYVFTELERLLNSTATLPNPHDVSRPYSPELLFAYNLQLANSARSALQFLAFQSVAAGIG